MHGPSNFLKSRLFFLWLGIVAISLIVTLFFRLGIKERIRSYLEDGEIKLATNPVGTDVYLDHQYLGKTPLHEKLRAGTYHLIFQRGRWQIPQGVTVKVRETSQASVSFNYAAINFASQPPGTDVIIDGAKIGPTPCVASEVIPGTHQIVYRLGAQSQSETIEVKEGDALKREISFDLYQSAIQDENKVIQATPEPAAWVGVWMGKMDHGVANRKSYKPTMVEKVQINSDLHTGVLIDHLALVPIQVPLSVTASGTKLEAQGGIQTGDILYSINVVLTRIPGQSRPAAEFIRRKFYLNYQTDENKSSGTLSAVAGN